MRKDSSYFTVVAYIPLNFPHATFSSEHDKWHKQIILNESSWQNTFLDMIGLGTCLY